MCEFCEGESKVLLAYSNADSMKVIYGQYCGVKVFSRLEMCGNKMTLSGGGSYRSGSDCYYEAEGLDTEDEVATLGDESYIRISYCPFCGREIKSKEYEISSVKEEIRVLTSELADLRVAYEEMRTYFYVWWKKEHVGADEDYDENPLTLDELMGGYDGRCYIEYGGEYQLYRKDRPVYHYGDKILCSCYSRPKYMSQVYFVGEDEIRKMVELGYLKEQGKKLESFNRKRDKMGEKIGKKEVLLEKLKRKLEGLYDEEASRRVREVFPRELLTEEEIGQVKGMEKVKAIKWLAKKEGIEGLKAAHIWYDEYIGGGEECV